MEEDDERTPIMIFGRDVTTIPCFRESFLYGIGGGVVGGLVTFMLTSKPKLGSHIGFATYLGTTLSYWMYCRINWSRQKLEADKLRELIEQHAAYRGTQLEKDIDQELKPSLPLVDA